jgi:hypothetical protein
MRRIYEYFYSLKLLSLSLSLSYLGELGALAVQFFDSIRPQRGPTMSKNGFLLAIMLLAGLGSASEAQIVVPGGQVLADRPRVVTDRGANIRSPRKERNRWFAARPVYPPVERGAAARINFAPFTNKYYPRGNEPGSPLTTPPSVRGR